MTEHILEIERVQEQLLRLKQLYQQNLVLMEGQDYDFLDAFLEEREQVLLILKAHPDALEAVGAASPHLWQELLALEEEFVHCLQQHYDEARQTLHEDTVRQRHIKGYTGE